MMQIFELLWRLACHDIWFVWDRAEYLRQDSDEVLAAVPFKVSRKYLIYNPDGGNVIYDVTLKMLSYYAFYVIIKMFC